jgi:hypothetical protein
MNEPIHIISLGAGVQSSTMALMAAAGEITPMPKCAIFADTQAEPKSVYTWLDWLEKQLPFPVHRVTQGSLEADTLKIRKRKDGTGFYSHSGVPAFTKGADGSPGMMPRQCTGHFKLAPIMREIRRILKQHGEKQAVQWIGISVDEIYRMKSSGVRYSVNRWPLVDAGMTRHKCLAWMAAKRFPTPPRSACVFCPYHSDTEWRRLRDTEPEEFLKAVRFEKAFQAAKCETVGIRSIPYLHASRKPLSEVDFSTEEERGQLNMFNNECEGMCGV